jgi:hypothetical protein
VRDELEFHYVSKLDEVLAVALERMPEPLPAKEETPAASPASN